MVAEGGSILARECFVWGALAEVCVADGLDALRCHPRVRGFVLSDGAGGYVRVGGFQNVIGELSCGVVRGVGSEEGVPVGSGDVFVELCPIGSGVLPYLSCDGL